MSFLENQQLTELRVWFLSRLMNGQVNVAKADESLSVAAEPILVYR